MAGLSMTIEAFLDGRLLVREPVDVISSQSIKDIFKAFQFTSSVNLIVISSSEAQCEGVLDRSDGSQHIIFDLQSVRFSWDIFIAASHADSEVRQLLAIAAISNLALLKSLNYPLPTITLALLMRDFDHALIAHVNNNDLSPPFKKDEWLYCQIAITIYLTAHESTHLDSGLFSTCPDIWSKMSDDLRVDAGLMGDNEYIQKFYANQLADLINRHQIDCDIIAHKELVCDCVGINSVMDYIFSDNVPCENRRVVVLCLAAAIISNWASEILTLRLNSFFEDNECKYNNEIDAAVLARCHCMAIYAVEEWLFRMKDAEEEKEYAAKLVDTVNELIDNVDNGIEELFGSGAETAWRRAHALVSTNIIDLGRMQDFILKNA
ncbi:hypothetical protein M2322_004779 [Rhodoblastus acidophilus]|uniref:hypothetical protein n=1 Tax=Rhodoblastus acidophilus TaxID=1074 RepID=UPI002224492E|nr:hypothetical protein [Rhodoblastus acidophilus]MCW2319210.1 hypothetical protein [Rhodoblastus acidophilus]